MDEQRSRIHDDLRGLIAGDLLLDPLDRADYSIDASLHEVEPLAIVAPRHLDDVTTVVRYAASNRIAIHPRGAGTGLAGESLGAGIVVDFSRYFNRVIEIADDRAIVQPGVVLDSLNAQLLPFGRRIGAEAGGSESCTIGGMIAADAAGPRSLRYGTTADAVDTLKIVYSHGETGIAEIKPWPSDDESPVDFERALIRKLANIIRYHGETTARDDKPRLVHDRAGYALAAAAKAAGIDLARLLVGAEGTLAIVTEATLKTVAIPASHAVVLAVFDRLIDAAAAAPVSLAFAPAACELLDPRLIRLAREVEPDLLESWPETAQGALLIAFEGDHSGEIALAANSAKHALAISRGIAADPILLDRKHDCERTLSLRRRVLPALLRKAPPKRPVPLVEDVAVPVETLADYLHKIQNIFKKFHVSSTIYAHAGAGRVHARPFLDLSDPADRAKLAPLAEAVHEAAASLGGTISGEHGCGLTRSWLLRTHKSDLYPLYRGVKDAFDPDHIFNPGKIVVDDPRSGLGDLRAFPRLTVRGEENFDHAFAAESALDGSSWNVPVIVRSDQEPEIETSESSDSFAIEQRLRLVDSGLLEIASACNGCGACRSREPELRMCPAFRALGVEAATPRAQANVIRSIAVGRLDPRMWGGDEVKQHANLCVHCEMCRSECPAGVDVSTLMIEAKAAYVNNHGLSTTDWLTSRVDRWARLASRFPIAFQFLFTNPLARRLLERTTGLSRFRRLPRPRRGSFLDRARKLGLTRPRPDLPGPRVAYFVDIFADHFDPELAETAIAVLRHAGVNVYVPPRQKGCGMPAYVAGDLDRARELALANLRILGEAVRDGYTIVCTEPTAALMIKHHYQKLTDDLDAELVAENTLDLIQYLSGLDSRGLLPPLDVPLHAKVGYHQPCHLRALNVGTPGLDLIRRVPGLDVEFIDRGCSGMAGTFGLARRNFRASLRAGGPLRARLREGDINLGATECGACRMQMEQAAPKWTLHPIELVALAMGLAPGLRNRVGETKPKRLVY